MRYPMIILFSLLLSSCQQTSSAFSSKSLSHDYEEVAGLTVCWENIFFLLATDYYVYIYSPGCSHCQALKDSVIEYAMDKPRIPLYFVLADASIPRGNDPSKTLGATTIEEAFIVGWPSLIEIKSSVLVKHFVGTEAIRTELF